MAAGALHLFWLDIIERRVGTCPQQGLLTSQVVGDAHPTKLVQRLLK
ncbi:MAG: hypothetical protein QG652_1111 [Pseudomonadota bacterium]|nr:hypothetical protein [Pseudomonadota bacterium]